MSVDLRAFHYALEPLLRRRRWELDAAEAKLGQATRNLAEGMAVLAQREAVLAQEQVRAAEAPPARLDPERRRNALLWLAELRTQIARARDEVAALRQRRDAVAADCRERQVRVEVIERHRESALAEYAGAQEARMTNAADADWLARRGAGSSA